MIVSPETNYSSDTSLVVSDLFMSTGDGIGSYNPELENGSNPSKEPLILYTMDQLVDFVRRTRDNYFVTLEDTEMLSSIYSSKNETTNEIVPMKMYTFTSNNAILGYYEINATSLGPFNQSFSQLKTELFDVREMSINFEIHQYINPYAATEGTCFLESVMQRYSFAKRGVVTVTADVKRTTCDVVDYMTRDGLPIPMDD